MKTLIKILCLSSFLFAEDVYPYFSDTIKQLEFEKGKIQIITINIFFIISYFMKK